MTEWIHFIEIAVSGGIVVALFKFAAVVGAMQQEQKNHAAWLDRHENRFDKLDDRLTLFGAHK
jgi:hypothetical protein